jgi:hypothetical protein
MSRKLTHFHQFCTARSEQEHFQRFFAMCAVGEVCTYSEAFDFNTVKRMAREHGVLVRYCEPGTVEYKEFGCFNFLVIGKTLTTENIAAIGVGTVVCRTIDVEPGMLPKPDAHWSKPVAVVEVFARGVDRAGKPFVAFYTQHGENARMSASATVGEGHIRIETCRDTERRAPTL